MSMPPQTAALDDSVNRRTEFWSRIGQVDDAVITHLISPGLLGGSSWPTTRQAYRVIRRSGRIIIASDGLSDPFDNARGSGNGFGLELFVETADIAPEYAGRPGSIEDIKYSWAFELIKHVADTVADAGGILPQLGRFGILSMELPGFSRSHALAKQVPPAFATGDDALGVLIGQPKQDFPDVIADMPLSPVKIVPVTLVLADELLLLRGNDPSADRTIVDGLTAAGIGHRIELHRSSVL